MAVLPGAGSLGLILIGVGLVTGCATGLGGTLALKLQDRIHLILGFSAGAVIGVALLDLLPEALELGARTSDAFAIAAVVAAGFVGYLAVDRALLILGGQRTGHRGHMGAASLTVHSLLDGLGIGFGFQVSMSVGAVLAVAVLAHDFADGVNTVNLSLMGTGSRPVARRWLIADAAAPLVGIGASRLVVVPGPVLALIIALFAGFFLYIGASELLPESHHRHPRVWTTATTVLGVALIFVVLRLAR
ncbi:MAG: ZIP family metal transporter [Caulobacteraceae bacterium]